MATKYDGANWTVDQVAEVFGVSRGTMAKYLRGAQYPSLMMMRRIQENYGWHVHDQIDLHPDMGYDDRYSIELRKKLDDIYSVA